MQTFQGHVEDDDGFLLEIWTSSGPDKTPDHVFVMYGGSQITDFPFKRPRVDCDISDAAQQVAEKDEVITLSLPILVE